MLNELTLIRNGLEDQCIETFHKNLKIPGKKFLLRVILSSNLTDCRIDNLHCVQDKEHGNYWTQGDGNKNHFPAVKLHFPLRRGGVEAYKAWKQDNKNPSVAKQFEFIENLRKLHNIDISENSTFPKYREKLIDRLEIYKNLRDEATIVHSLLETFLAIGSNEGAFFEELDKMLWNQCKISADKEILNISSLIMFAHGKSSNNNLIPDEIRPTLLFDIENGDYSAANEHWKKDISSVMYEYEGKENSSKQRYGTCAISGELNVPLVTDTFPSTECNHLGNVKLFSRKVGVMTYERYGRGAAHSLNVSKNLADELAGALRYLNRDELKGKTWDKLPSDISKSAPDLLLAFCRSKPDIEPIRLFMSDKDNLEETEYEFEAKQICESFKGNNPNLDAEPRVDFLIIRKISDGVQKAIFSSSNSLHNLSVAADNWVQASENLPPIQLKYFVEGEKFPRYRSPKAIYPQQFAFLFTKHYNRNLDREPSAIPGIPFSEVLALFLNQNYGIDSVSRLLNRLTRQFANLLEQVALDKTKPAKHHPDAHDALIAMGLLLFKLDRTKEVYMNELSYKLGQFCAALDEIHIGYCHSQRKGQKPERLIGNQAYSTAVVNPIKALEITAQRAAVYVAWAKKIDLGSEVNAKIKNAKFAYFWLQKHSGELHQMIPNELPTSTPASKAELLLGYLSGRPIGNGETSNLQTTKTEGD